MSFRPNLTRTLIAISISLFVFSIIGQSQGVSIYTPYTKIVVPPGKKVKYTLDINNKSKQTQNIDLIVAGIPKGWSYRLISGGYDLKQISVQAESTKKAEFSVDIPFKATRGTYTFYVSAKGHYRLPLTVIVSREGAFKTEFTCNQKNMEGQATSTFNFNANLKNSTGETQRYALRSLAPRGWSVVFKPNNKQATSVELEPDKTSYITITIKPPRQVKEGTYKIPVKAETATSSSEMTLEVVITGSYGIELTTQTGLLSTKVTAGSEKRIPLVIKNTGSIALKDIRLKSTAPLNWEISYDPGNIMELAPGSTKDLTAVIKADKKAIAGDYITNLTAQTPETSSTISFRVTVRTPVLIGWIGILIIVLAIGGVYYLFQKYGRR